MDDLERECNYDPRKLYVPKALLRAKIDIESEDIKKFGVPKSLLDHMEKRIKYKK